MERGEGEDLRFENYFLYFYVVKEVVIFYCIGKGYDFVEYEVIFIVSILFIIF